LKKVGFNPPPAQTVKTYQVWLWKKKRFPTSTHHCMATAAVACVNLCEFKLRIPVYGGNFVLNVHFIVMGSYVRKYYEEKCTN